METQNTTPNKKKDYLRYILAAIFLTLAVVFYVRDINKKQAEQADLNFIHGIVSEQMKITNIDMIIDTEKKESKVDIVIQCTPEEIKAFTDAIAKAEPTDFLEEKREGKLFNVFLNGDNNLRYKVEFAVLDEDSNNAYIRALKPTSISKNDDKKEITWTYTKPAVIKDFGKYLSKIYEEKLPEIKRQSEFFQNALEKDENTRKYLEQSGKITLSPVTKEQTDLIKKQLEAHNAKDNEKVETPTTTEAPTTIE